MLRYKLAIKWLIVVSTKCLHCFLSPHTPTHAKQNTMLAIFIIQLEKLASKINNSRALRITRWSGPGSSISELHIWLLYLIKLEFLLLSTTAAGFATDPVSNYGNLFVDIWQHGKLNLVTNFGKLSTENKIRAACPSLHMSTHIPRVYIVLLSCIQWESHFDRMSKDYFTPLLLRHRIFYVPSRLWCITNASSHNILDRVFLVFCLITLQLHITTTTATTMMRI